MGARQSAVLGPDGNPVLVSTLTEDMLPPALVGVRQDWSNTIASGLTPDRLAQILRAANGGDNRDLLTLAEDMEERDTHYASVLGQRKRAVSGIEPVIMPGDDKDPRAKRAADEFAKVVEAPTFDDMVDNLLDALGKGYAAVQPLWDFGEMWRPRKYKRHDPRRFQFDADDELRIRTANDQRGLEVPPYTLIVHRPRLKSGLTVRSGLARLVCWTFMLKSYTLQDWAAFLEVFGMPLRVGRYDAMASADEKRVLLRAVRDLATDAAAIIPKGMEIDFIEAKGGSGNAVFGAMADYLDKQVSKAVIGQTMTTDEGSSRAQSEVHDEVRLDIRRADAKQLGTTVSRDLAAPFTAFNFGPDVAPPQVIWPVEDPEDITTFSEAVARLVPLGLEIAASDVAKRMGLRLADKDEAVLRAPVSAGVVPQTARQLHGAACPGCGTTQLAAATPSIDEDQLVSEAMAQWEMDVAPIIDPILEAARSVKAAGGGFAEFEEALARMAPDTVALARRLALSGMMARGDGDVGE